MREIDSEVNTAKGCDEWRREYMTLALEMEKERQAARAEVKAETVIGMLQEKLSIDMIARVTKLTVEEITAIGRKQSLI